MLVLVKFRLPQGNLPNKDSDNCVIRQNIAETRTATKEMACPRNAYGWSYIGSSITQSRWICYIYPTNNKKTYCSLILIKRKGILVSVLKRRARPILSASYALDALH